MFRAVQLSGPNCLISLGLTFNDVVLCRSRSMMIIHIQIAPMRQICHIHFYPFFAFRFDSGSTKSRLVLIEEIAANEKIENQRVTGAKTVGFG